MIELVLATRNKGKIKELESMLNFNEIKIYSLNDFPQIPPIEENGKSFKENALIKAKTVALYTNKITLADDSGLCVDFLNGAPGIHSARYSGDNASDKDRINKLLNELEGVPLELRTAKFICVLALFHPLGKTKFFKGECKGIIDFSPKGDEGFGFDPIFLVPKFNKTFAQLGPSIKNKISHRAKALKSLKRGFSKFLYEV